MGEAKGRLISYGAGSSSAWEAKAVEMPPLRWCRCRGTEPLSRWAVGVHGAVRAAWPSWRPARRKAAGREDCQLEEDWQLSGATSFVRDSQLDEYGRAQSTASTVYVEPTGKLGLCMCQELEWQLISRVSLSARCALSSWFVGIASVVSNHILNRAAHRLVGLCEAIKEEAEMDIPAFQINMSCLSEMREMYIQEASPLALPSRCKSGWHSPPKIVLCFSSPLCCQNPWLCRMAIGYLWARWAPVFATTTKKVLMAIFCHRAPILQSRYVPSFPLLAVSMCCTFLSPAVRGLGGARANSSVSLSDPLFLQEKRCHSNAPVLSWHLGQYTLWDGQILETER